MHFLVFLLIHKTFLLKNLYLCHCRLRVIFLLCNNLFLFLALLALFAYSLIPLFYEHMHYYKEIMMDVEFLIDVEIDGYSDDGRFFSLFQNFYDMSGNHLAHLDLAFGIMDTKRRKLISMPNESFEIFKEGPKSKTFSIITKEDLRKHGKFPENK